MSGGHDYGDITAPTPHPLDRDKLSMVSRAQAAQAAHLALFAIQNERPEVMMGGVAILFAAFIHRCGLDPQEVHHMGMKILRDPADPGYHNVNISLQSLKDFAGIRVMGERHVSIA